MNVNKANNSPNFNALYKINRTNLQQGKKTLEVLKNFLEISGNDMRKVHVEEINNPLYYIISTPHNGEDAFLKSIEKINLKSSSIEEFRSQKISLTQETLKKAKLFGNEQIEALKNLTKNYLENLKK